MASKIRPAKVPLQGLCTDCFLRFYSTLRSVGYRSSGLEPAIWSMSFPQKEQPAPSGMRAHAAETLHDFLVRELPPTREADLAYFVDAISAAGERYDRLAMRKDAWWSYTRRRQRLLRIGGLAERLASEIGDLDVLSRDDLQRRLGGKELVALLGALRFLCIEASGMAEATQTQGKPRDLAEELWVLELADIYENTFARPASISGSGDEPSSRRGKFYRFLQLSRPSAFPRYGRLSLKHLKRTARGRKAAPPLAAKVLHLSQK
jgi:hypothetical protein